MSTLPPLESISLTASVRGQQEPFDEHWLRHVHWSAIDADGGLVRWRVRSPIATRDWMVLRPRSDAADADFHRMEREWRLAGQLDGTWALVPIAQLHTPDGPITVLDDDGGRPLSTVADGRLSVERFLRLAISATGALAAAHQQGLVHCDIKPSNLILGRDDQVRLSGFALARHASIPQPEGISGSLPYMSPEQGGRLDLPADQRSDLYSLGIAFYELLTGHLPFHADDPVAWLHQHVALPAPPLAARRSELPEALEDLLQRLLAKRPDARPNSARALKTELRLALSEWTEFGHLRRRCVAVGKRDSLPTSLTLPGRAAALAQLLDSARRLERRLPGSVILLRGPAGMGKTTLVRQAHSDMAGSQVLFASARYELGQQNSPYAALAGALGSLLVRLLSLAPEQLEHWRERLLGAITPHGHMLAQLIPELLWVTGPLPGSNESSAADARLRLRQVLLRLLRALHGPQRPLLLFLDDLQWLDEESLLLLCELGSEDFRHLALVMAFREEDDPPNTRLDGLLAHCRALPVDIVEVGLAPLTLADTMAMVDAALAPSADPGQLLGQQLQRRSGGNPLFITQALQVLNEQPAALDVAALAPLHDIAALMATRLASLPVRTQQLLYCMALFGQRAPRDQLALAGDLTHAALTDCLAPALNAGLIREEHDGLGFCHDSVREAARALQPKARHADGHARIAARLAAALAPTASSASLFNVAAHILQAASASLGAQDRQRFIEVLVRSALRAKEAAAAPFALQYLTCAEQLLNLEPGPQAHETRYPLAYLHAQCLILNGEYRMADARIAALVRWTSTPAELTSLHVLKSEVLALAGDYSGAVEAALLGLRTLGLTLDADPGDTQAEQAALAVRQALGGRAIDSLGELPLLCDSTIASQIELLACAVIPGSFIRPNLMFMLLCQVVQLSLQYGVNASAVQAFAWFGVAWAHRSDAQAEGLAWAHLALRMVERNGFAQQKAAALLALGQVSVWLRPLPVALGHAEQAMRESLAGDMPSMACYANNHIVSDLLVMGAPIERILRQIDSGLGMARNLEAGDSQNILFIQALYIRRLAGTPVTAIAIPSRAQLAQRLGRSSSGRAAFWWNLFEGLFYYLEGNFATASEHLDRAWALSWLAPAHIHLIDLAFFSVLNGAAGLGPNARACARTALEGPMERLRHFAGLNPKAFADRLDLAEAELLRTEGHTLQALTLYDRSIAKAIACGAVHIQGLAHELASRCHQGLGLAVSTRAHQRHARDAWRRWGAVALAEQLEAEHPHLQDQPLATRASVELPGGQQQLDRLSITKACQALSREIELDQLTKTLLANTLVHAGASLAVLVLVHEGGWRVEASGQASAGGVEVTLCGHPAQAHDLPLTLVRSAVRGRRSVVLDTPQDHERFADDLFLQQRPGGSRLCIPLLKQSEIIGALYLENPLVYGVFGQARVDVLELLAAQAAISITTARMYRDLMEENRRRRDSEATLRTSRALLAIGQAGGRHGSFSWNPALDASFWSPELFAQLRLAPVGQGAPCQAGPRQAEPRQAGPRQAGPRQAEPRRTELAGHVHVDDRAHFEQALEMARQSRQAFRLEFRVNTQDGEVRYLQALGEPDGEQGYLGVIFDVSERQRTEAALRNARAELARISQATVLGELAASIAHEVNQPLVSILSNASASLRWLQRPQPAVSEAVEGMRDILLEGQRAADIINALRALARQAPANHQPVSLATIIGQVLHLTRTELEDRHTQVELRLAPLPPLTADPVQLQQVVLNLINNAADAMQRLPPSARRLCVETCAIAGGVLVMVEDQGPGIAAAQLSDIFKAFYTTKASGMGMGLAICSSIVTAHGGRLLALTGRSGQTIFAFTLPG